MYKIVHIVRGPCPISHLAWPSFKQIGRKTFTGLTLFISSTVGPKPNEGSFFTSFYAFSQDTSFYNLAMVE